MKANTVSQLTLLNTEIGTAVAPLTVKIGSNVCYENAHTIVEAVSDLLAQKPAKVVLEMDDVCMIDSSGLKVLLQSRKLCEEAGVLFQIGSISECVDRILRLSGLAEVFGRPEIEWHAHQTAGPSTAAMEHVKWTTFEHLVTSEASMISGLRESTMKAAQEAGATGEQLCDIQIAVGEALTNAYRHGSPMKGVNKIRLRCMFCPHAFVIEIEDEGKPFDADAVAEPDPKLMRDHGMGIYIMRQSMDVVEFTSNCPGNRVRMIKWIDSNG